MTLSISRHGVSEWNSDRHGNAPSSAAAPSPYPAPEISADPMTSINESNSLKIVSGLRMDDNVCASAGHFLFVISEI